MHALSPKPALLLALLLAPALARSQPPGPHTGLPVDGIDEALAAPRFHSARMGYSRDFPKGIARVYVGDGEAAATEWFDEMATRIHKQKPVPVDALGDAALQVGDKVLLVREANIGLMVETAAGAEVWMTRLRGAITDAPAAPPALPALRVEGAAFVVEAPRDCRQLSWVGGRLSAASTALDAPLRFDEPPSRLVAWDALGRAAVQDFDADGRPRPTPPLRPQAGLAAPQGAPP